MAKDGPYVYINVESYTAMNTSGLHGEIHIRPIEGEDFPQDIQVECSKELSRGYPVGTRFKIKAKLTDREGSGDYLYSYYRWPFDVIE
ncbi:MAG: hypothetical protein ACKE9I_04415 [Methylophagaceae bacterium]